MKEIVNVNWVYNFISYKNSCCCCCCWCCLKLFSMLELVSNNAMNSSWILCIPKASHMWMINVTIVFVRCWCSRSMLGSRRTQMMKVANTVDDCTCWSQSGCWWYVQWKQQLHTKHTPTHAYICSAGIFRILSRKFNSLSICILHAHTICADARPFSTLYYPWMEQTGFKHLQITLKDVHYCAYRAYRLLVYVFCVHIHYMNYETKISSRLE